MKIDAREAERVLREEAAFAQSGPVDPDWLGRIQAFSESCERASVRTHVAFLGVALLAKSVTREADLFAIKPVHSAENAGAFSARSLCHGVLVPLSAELGFSLGVTGREPLNNQPYFRMVRLDDGTPVLASSRAPFEFMLELVKDVNDANSEQVAREALRAFIAVRRLYLPTYAGAAGNVEITAQALKQAIAAFVTDNSEGGRRAQAVAAGLFDVFAGSDRVESGRINDPSRKYPGDVCVRSMTDPDVWEKAVEVRDKPVKLSDIQIFGAKCVAMGVRDAAVLMVAVNQPEIVELEIRDWADGRGLSMTLFHGWDTFVDQALYWGEADVRSGATAAVEFVRARLVSVEATPDAVDLWQKLTSG